MKSFWRVEIRLRWKAFGGWKFDWGTIKLHARILRGKGVQKKKPNKFTVGSSTSATFVLPVRHGTGVASQTRVWTQYGLFPKSSMEKSCKWDTMATMKKVRVLHRKALKPEDTDILCGVWWPSWSTRSKQQPTWHSHWISFSLPFRRNKVYASWKLDKASISANHGSHFQVHFVWQVWDGQLSPAFKSIRWKAFRGWKFDWGTTKLHARILRGKGVQKKKPNKFTVGSSTSATFVLPVRHGTGVASQKRVWTQYGLFPKSSMEKSCKWDTMATMKKVRVLHRKALKPEDTDILCGVWWPSWSTRSKQQPTWQFPLNKFFFTLQEEQSLCFLKAWQSIHLGQPWITFPSPFRVAGVGRSISTRF